MINKLLTLLIFLVCIGLGASIIGIMARNEHFETPMWVLASLGLSAVLMSVGACFCGASDDE